MRFSATRLARLVCAAGVLSVAANARAESASAPNASGTRDSATNAAAPAPSAGAAPAKASDPQQSAPPTSAALAMAPAESAETSSWTAEYVRARSALREGRFAAAAHSFASLALSAHTAEKRALCTELAALGQHWADAGLTLRANAQGGAGPTSAAHSSERTTDEISVLYLNSVLYGLGSGAWLATLSEPKEPASAILPALGLAGAAAGAVALLDHRAHFAYGVPASAVTGLYIGLEEGLTWSIWNQAKAAYYDEWHASTVATVIWGSATAGLITGATVGSLAGTTPGRASYVGSTALWGGVLSGLFTASLSADDRAQRDDHALLGAALGTNVGTVAGILSAGTLSPSVARVRFMDLGGIGGGILASGIYVSAADRLSEDNARGLFGVTALGIASGLAVAAVLTQGLPADRGSAVNESASALDFEPTLIPVRGGTLIGAAGTF